MRFITVYLESHALQNTSMTFTCIHCIFNHSILFQQKLPKNDKSRPVDEQAYYIICISIICNKNRKKKEGQIEANK